MQNLPHYRFIKANKQPSWLNDTSNSEYLDKWFLKLNENMFFDYYHYEPAVAASHTNHFLTLLMKQYLNLQEDANIDVDYEIVKCQETRMDMFDSLYKHGIVNKESNLIKKCPDIFLSNDITVSDCLRRTFLCSQEEYEATYSSLYLYDDDDLVGENGGLSEPFSEDQRKEFLYEVMKRLVTGGGSLCQYEDEYEPYFNLTKKIYKDMISVQKVHQRSELYVTTDIYLLKSVTVNGDYGRQQSSSNTRRRPNCKNLLFGGHDHEYNFCFVAVDKLNQKCTIWRTIFQPVLM